MLRKNSKQKIIIGLGKTGFACAQFLAAQNIPFAVMDSREAPPFLDQFLTTFPQVEIKIGEINNSLLKQASELIVSPGVILEKQLRTELLNLNINIIGDIELFARYAKAPICAITGSNAKTTVTSLVYAMAQASHINARVGGNIGNPALTLLQDKEPELYILELSSFQLESTYNLHPMAATILNLSPDHMDRYNNDIDRYANAKQRVYTNAHYAIINRDDPYTYPQNASAQEIISFGLSLPAAKEFGLISLKDKFYLSYGGEKLLNVEQLKIIGKHNWINALAALALGYALKFPMKSMLEALTEFSGLAHRCQWIRNRNGVDWYNDSKGTNVGATVAAIEGLGMTITGKIILIAGGIAKNADFSPLVILAKQYVSHVILLGIDAPLIAQALEHHISFSYVTNLQEAVAEAAQYSQVGDCVLLSPACSSLDMFKNFEERGDVFVHAVKDLN